MPIAHLGPRANNIRTNGHQINFSQGDNSVQGWLDGIDAALVSGGIVHAYGSMYADDVAQTIVIVSALVPVQIPGGFTTGLCSAFTFQNNRELICGEPGIYLVNYSLTIRCPTSDTSVEATVMLNGVNQLNTTAETRLKEGGVPLSLSGTGILSLAIGNTISLAVENQNNAADFVMTHGNLTVVKIGET